MTWHWRLEDPSGAAIDPASLGVEVADSDNQGDAESWLGENWRELLARGVATVTLLGRSVQIRPDARQFTYDFGDGKRLGPTKSVGGTYPGGGPCGTFASAPEDSPCRPAVPFWQPPHSGR